MAQFHVTQLEDVCDTIDLWLMFEADCSSVRGVAPVWNCTLCGFHNRVQNMIAYTAMLQGCRGGRIMLEYNLNHWIMYIKIYIQAFVFVLMN